MQGVAVVSTARATFEYPLPRLPTQVMCNSRFSFEITRPGIYFVTPLAVETNMLATYVPGSVVDGEIRRVRVFSLTDLLSIDAKPGAFEITLQLPSGSYRHESTDCDIIVPVTSGLDAQAESLFCGTGVAVLDAGQKYLV